MAEAGLLSQAQRVYDSVQDKLQLLSIALHRLVFQQLLEYRKDMLVKSSAAVFAHNSRRLACNRIGNSTRSTHQVQNLRHNGRQRLSGPGRLWRLVSNAVRMQQNSKGRMHNTQALRQSFRAAKL
ncbi:hypothetical protein GGI06_001511 [Coemansia sp. S85]|nr:hypothetical protein GGI06_001511 [Coemansia sp. S85]